MHYLIILITILAIVFLQFRSFKSNREKLLTFKCIFPDIQSQFKLVKDEANDDVLRIMTHHKNDILEVILSSLNNYLDNNKSAVSDFHLMKDIVDRNCDAKEEEIQTQIPVPLYLGLIGTMSGILIGVGFLVFGGGLNELLNSNTGSGTAGIEALLGGVALAMISSIIGILLTTVGSYINRNAKANVEKNKNTFLSWIQAELLPNISSDTSSALVRMTQNLTTFNSAFAENTKDLRTTLSNVNDSYKIQADLIQAINKLKIKDIAAANIEVYDKLKNSTNEVGVFAEYLQKTNEYLDSIQTLNQKLDDYERRTQVIENAGNFFAKNEKWLAENFDIANLEVKEAIERFKGNTSEYLTKLQESLNEQILNLNGVTRQQQDKLEESLIKSTEIISEFFINRQQAFDTAILDQQNALKDKLQETTKLVEELKNFTHIKEGIKDFKESINKQNQKIEELVIEIRALAKAKIEGGTNKQAITLPKWTKILIISGSSLFAVICLIYIILFLHLLLNG